MKEEWCQGELYGITDSVWFLTYKSTYFRFSLTPLDRQRRSENVWFQNAFSKLELWVGGSGVGESDWLNEGVRSQHPPQSYILRMLYFRICIKFTKIWNSTVSECFILPCSLCRDFKYRCLSFWKHHSFGCEGSYVSLSGARVVLIFQHLNLWL